MSNHLSSNMDFISSFVTVCYENGLNEKQACALFDDYAKNEFYLNDKDFKEGFDNTVKQAAGVGGALYNLAKAIGTVAMKHPKISLPVGGSLAAGALAPEGILPDDYSGGVLAGGALGGLLGLLATKGKGLGTAVKRLGTAATQGGLGRTTTAQGLKLLTQPKLWRGVGTGAASGAAAVGVNKLTDFISNIHPNIPPAFRVPSSAGKEQSSRSVMSNPYELPNEVMARNVAGLNTSGGASDVLSGKKQQLIELENKISEMQRSLPIASNPSAYSERLALQAQLDNLKEQRNLISSSIDSEAQNLANESQMARANALERQDAASRGVQTYQNEYENLMRRQQIEQGGGIGGSLMGMYNQLTGLPSRLKTMAPGYSAYQSELERAQADQAALK
jgi:hypothetical protein